MIKGTPKLHLPTFIFCDQCHGFGYHVPTNEYKVVRITCLREGTTTVAYIYTFNNGEWHCFTFPSSAKLDIVQEATVSIFCMFLIQEVVQIENIVIYTTI